MSENQEKQQLKVVYRDLNYQVDIGSRRKPQIRNILKNVSGSFLPGRLTAIMGASGAGKTSLLNVLAGEATSGQVSGQIYLNQQEMIGEQMKQVSGFVFQEDMILSTMTVKEAIGMSALLRLPSSVTESERESRIMKIIETLNLTKCVNTIVGNQRIKGISGGERKRTAVAMELITNPHVLFLDEPTTGLDTFTAYGVMKVLKDLAHETNRTIIATVHQPSSELFQLFDDLLLLADGRVMYEGEAAHARVYFEKLGYPCPEYSNPADYIFMDILNNEEGSSSYKDINGVEKNETNQERIARLLDIWPTTDEGKAWAQRHGSLSQGHITKADMKTTAPFATQLNYLFYRGFRSAVRNPLVLKPKIGQTVVISLLLGLLYFKNSSNSDDVARIQNYMGVFFFIAMSNTFQNANENLTVFGNEKAIFVREKGAGYYGLPAFFLSKFMVELPFQIVFPAIRGTVVYWMVGLAPYAKEFFIFLGYNFLSSLAGLALGICIACAFEKMAIALVVTPLILLPLMLFSGLFANNNAIPVYLDWIKYISPIKYTFEGFVRNQFSDPRVLATVGFTNDVLTVTNIAIILIVIIVFLVLLSYISLYRLVNGKKATWTKQSETAKK